MENVYNNLSEKLKEEVRSAAPKPGQVIYFSSVQPKARGTTVLSTDRIFDPWAKKINDDEYEGAYIDISYITGQTPANGKEPARNSVGRIQFTRSSNGVIPIRGGNKADELLFQYLFLTNFSKNNLGKPWHVPNQGSRPLFFMKEASKTAKDMNEIRRKKRLAGDVIDQMPDGKLREFAIGLEMKGINSHSSPDEIRDQLYRITETKDASGAEKIIGLDKDVTIRIKIDIKDAEKYGVIELDRSLNQMIWPDTKEVVCTVSPGRNVYEALTQYFLGKGSEVYTTIKALTDRKRENEKPKKEEGKNKPK